MIAWSVETLIASTLLMLVVLALRTPVRRGFGPTVAYALWLLPAIRMMLPPLPAHWRGSALPVLPVPEDITIYLGQPVAVLPVQPAGGVGWPTVALGLWAIGALAFASYHIVAHGRFCARVRRRARAVSLVANGRVRVIETDAATGPLAFGVWRKYVAFPRDFAERYEPLERDLALAHELGHHARGDLIANWAALLVLALHWFNPVAWRAYRAFRADQEMACDALVLSGRAPGLRQAYGRAIVKSAHGGAVSAACHLHTINEIKGRLKMLTVHERMSKPRVAMGAGAIGALALGCLGLTASGTQAAERVRTGVESATGVDLAGIDLPTLAPQTAPAPAPAPKVEPATPATAAKPHRQIRIITRDKDGKTTETVREDDGVGPVVVTDLSGTGDTGPGRGGFRVFAGGDRPTSMRIVPGSPDTPLPPLPPEALVRLKSMPQITSGDCGDKGRASDFVINGKGGAGRRFIICTTRIQRASAAAAADAAQAAVESGRIERTATASALSGLRNARASIQNNRDMTDAQRAGALSGIDQAIRELEAR